MVMKDQRCRSEKWELGKTSCGISKRHYCIMSYVFIFAASAGMFNNQNSMLKCFAFPDILFPVCYIKSQVEFYTDTENSIVFLSPADPLNQPENGISK